jgi:acetyl-CoA carboxylase carboxyl transferase subunit alpha
MAMDILPHEKQIYEYVKTIEHLKKQNNNNPLFNNEIQKLELKLQDLKCTVYSDLTPWERIQISRHPSRPHAVDYIENISDSFHELCGDRLYADDRAVVGGLALVGGRKCMLIGQEKGNDTESRVKHNFGMPHPEGFRKALRLMKLADKFGMPIVTMLDTPGAFPGLEAEERGQAFAIATNLREMAKIQTPIIVLLIGEGSSGGALGMGLGDVIGMLEHAYYSVISPEGCASILWKDASKNVDAAKALQLNAENLKGFDIIDSIIPEPLGGAHHNPEEMYRNVTTFITEQIDILKRIPKELITEQRYLKFRRIGEFYEATQPNIDKTEIKEPQEACEKE